MTVVLDEIKTKEWSLSMAGLGEIVTGVYDIMQCMQIIVRTQKGSDPFRPDFGCDIFIRIGMPINAAAPLMVQDIQAAIKRWEPRAEVQDATFFFTQPSKLTIRIFWMRTESDDTTVYDTDFNIEEGIVYLS